MPIVADILKGTVVATVVATVVGTVQRTVQGFIERRRNEAAWDRYLLLRLGELERAQDAREHERAVEWKAAEHLAYFSTAPVGSDSEVSITVVLEKHEGDVCGRLMQYFNKGMCCRITAPGRSGEMSVLAHPMCQWRDMLDLYRLFHSPRLADLVLQCGAVHVTSTTGFPDSDDPVWSDPSICPDLAELELEWAAERKAAEVDQVIAVLVLRIFDSMPHTAESLRESLLGQDAQAWIAAASPDAWFKRSFDELGMADDHAYMGVTGYEYSPAMAPMVRRAMLTYLAKREQHQHDLAELTDMHRRQMDMDMRRLMQPDAATNGWAQPRSEDSAPGGLARQWPTWGGCVHGVDGH